MAHRRLAIIDLSEAGAQPMMSGSGRFVVVFNGEIYNHLTLRRALSEAGQAPRWRGASDTESLLACIDAWGLARTLEQIRGMFAFALWDRAERTLTLTRDPVGEKPLYYAVNGRGIAFGSELKALMTLPEVDRALDPRAVSEFLRLGYVPDPLSIFSAVRKVPAGTFVQIGAELVVQSPRAYWSLTDLAVSSRRRTEPPAPSFDAASHDLERILQEVVASQMISDVPIGAFLSGGIDSTAVTMFMQRAAQAPVRTYSIGFDGSRFDESAHAAKVAHHLGTAHTELRVSSRDALDLIPDIARSYDEPFADASQVPTMLLCRLARREVTVALTGDGGDEVFGGYNRHVLAPRLWRYLSSLPRWARRPVAALSKQAQVWGRRDDSFLRKGAASLGLPVTTIDKLGHFGELAAHAHSLSDLHHGLESVFLGDLSPFLVGVAEDVGIPGHEDLQQVLSPTDAMILADTLRYLPGDILTKVDRAAMSASLETRAPMLDRHVIEASWALPPSARVQGGVGKRILRDIVTRHVPADLVERPKQGFAVPIDQWMRGELSEWMHALLDKKSIDATGVFRPDGVSRLLQEHMSGRGNHGLKLWHLAMFQSWHATYCQK